MRYILLFTCILPFTAFSQTKVDADQVMGKFKIFYNAVQNDSMNNMFSASDRISGKENAKNMKWYMDKYGTMISFQYLGIDNEDPEHVFVFKTSWTKGGQKTSSFTLDKGNKFMTFRLGTSSPGIDKLLKK